MSPSQMRKREQWKCKFKLKLTPEEAAARIWRYPQSVGYYLCGCGWIHAGHPPVYMVADSVRAIAAHRQQRHEASVRRQKARLVKPKWMTNEIPVRKMDKSA